MGQCSNGVAHIRPNLIARHQCLRMADKSAFVSELPLISFEDSYQSALQSQTRTYVTIKRLKHPTGRVIVPWKLVPELSESPYSGIVGR